MVWVIAGVCVAIFVVVSVIVQLALCRSAKRMFEHIPPLNAGRAGVDAGAEELRFSTSDGLTLHGCLYRPRRSPKGLILFCPELGGNVWSCRSYCQALIDAGFAVLAFDFRSHGLSERMAGYEPLHWLTEHELADLRAVLHHIDNDPELCLLPLGTFGVSRGGGAAIAAAIESPRVACIACEGAYSTRKLMSLHSRRWVSLFVPEAFSRLVPRWQIEITLAGARLYSQWKRRHQYLNLESYLGKLKTQPMLLIAGERDSYVLPEMSQALRSEIPSPHVEVELVPKARHNKAREVDPAAYDSRLANFFLQHMPALIPSPLEQPSATPLAS